MFFNIINPFHIHRAIGPKERVDYTRAITDFGSALRGLFFKKCPCYYNFIQYRINNEITAPELRIIDESGTNLGVLKLSEALEIARSKNLDLIEISTNATPPVARIMSFDKFRYQKEKEKKRQRIAQKAKILKQVRISPRAAQNDLHIKAAQAENFLKDGHKVEVNLFLRGREKQNKDWALQKLKEFLMLIKVPHIITLEPRAGGHGFVVQIIKK